VFESERLWTSTILKVLPGSGLRSIPGGPPRSWRPHSGRSAAATGRFGGTPNTTAKRTVRPTRSPSSLGVRGLDLGPSQALARWPSDQPSRAYSEHRQLEKATRRNTVGTLIIPGLGAAIAYALACAAWPYANCSRCKGSGKRQSPSGKAFGDCRRCGGKGRRVRLGRRIWGAGPS
jgi:hypothetical protein